MNATPQGKIILLIDPDPGTRPLLEYALAGTGLEVRQFGSGQEGLEAVPQLRPKLIICEFMTADWTGKTIFDRFVTDPALSAFRQTPFIFFSHQTYKRMFKSAFLNRGLWGWFTKPFGAHELREVIENIFQGVETTQTNRELRQQVKRSEYRYRDFLENANDFIFTLDDDGCFNYLNNRFTQLTNLDKEPWIGQNFLEFIIPEDRDLAIEHYEMAHQGRARIFEARVITQNPAPLVLSFNITPMVERGAIAGSIGIARDVTERKSMEKEILELKNFNESIIESMEAGLLTLDLEGRLISLNRGGEAILGWTPKEAVGLTLEEIVGPEKAAVLLGKAGKRGPLKYSREIDITTRQGQNVVIGFTSTDRIDNQRQKVGTILSFRDITQLKQMQSEVIRMDRLVALGVLASGIAHEIKNPLAGIKALAQACDEEFEGEDPRREYLSRIVRQVNRLDDLLKTFFVYARPQPPDRKPHDLRDILSEVMTLVGKKLSVSNIQLDIQAAAEMPRAYVDAQQLQQVFLNLILNAVDAMPQGGEIRFGFSSENGDGGLPLVRVDVADTGTGIAPNKLETIFDPFFTTKPNGLGLGLSIVYRIVTEHNGEIRVKSTKGKGTTFTLRLPTGVKA